MTTPMIVQQTMSGSHGEHDLQERYGTQPRAEAFYKHQVLYVVNTTSTVHQRLTATVAKGRDYADWAGFAREVSESAGL